MSRRRPLAAFTKCLDGQTARYEQLRGVADVRSYLTAKADRADEEMLTEPILALIIEQVLGFPTDGYFPQLEKGGQKPDFTPIDLIAHPFVLDAKSSAESLDGHEPCSIPGGSGASSTSFACSR